MEDVKMSSPTKTRISSIVVHQFPGQYRKYITITYKSGRSTYCCMSEAPRSVKLFMKYCTNEEHIDQDILYTNKLPKLYPTGRKVVK